MKNNNTSSKRLREAAALKYSPLEDNVPKIIALGKGETADRIIDAAEKSNVPVYEDSGLASLLNSMSIGDEIPRELYGLVAEILVFVSSIDKDYGEKYGVI